MKHCKDEFDKQVEELETEKRNQNKKIKELEETNKILSKTPESMEMYKNQIISILEKMVSLVYMFCFYISYTMHLDNK